MNLSLHQMTCMIGNGTLAYLTKTWIFNLVRMTRF